MRPLRQQPGLVELGGWDWLIKLTNEMLTTFGRSGSTMVTVASVGAMKLRVIAV